MLAWLKKEQAAAPLLKIAGIIILVLSLSNMLCISYYMVRYWNDGYFKTPLGMGQMGMMTMGGSGMGSEMMMKKMDCPMMQDMMKKGMDRNTPGMPQKSTPDAAPSAEDHEAHH